MFRFKKKNRKLMPDNELVKQTYISDEQIDIKKSYVKEVLRNKHLPIVLLDPLWLIMREQVESDYIKQGEIKLRGLLKEQGKLNNDFKEYNAVKQSFLKQIMDLSAIVQQTSSDSKIEELNKLHQSIIVTNGKLEQIEQRLEQVDEEIKLVNEEIIEEMVAIGYSYIESCKSKQQALEEEIAILRDEMLHKTNEKKQSEKLSKDIYSYLHSIIGQNQIETIDKVFWEKKK